MKKGISLIVLVVTIIVMIIIAGAIIISLNNTNVIDMGEQAVQKHNEQSIEEAINVAYQDLLVTNLGKVSTAEVVERLQTLSQTYTEIENITAGNGKVFYTVNLTGKEYQISTATGEVKEYEDAYAKVVGDSSLWTRSGTTITGYTGTGEQLKNVIVPNVLTDANGNEINITTVKLSNIYFEGTLTVANGLIVRISSLPKIENIVLGNDCTIVHAHSFNNMAILETITAGQNLFFDGANGNTSGLDTFKNCPNLKKITIESISKDIPNWTFSNAKEALQGEIVINEGAERIGYSAFLDCKNITNVVIPNSVTELAGETFRNCTSLTGKMIIQAGVALGLNCLNNTGITELEVGEGIYIKQVVSGCNALKKIVIKDNCEFWMGQINNCSALETIEFGENIKLNGSWSDGRYTFQNCPSLKCVTIKSISGDVPNWFSYNIGEVLRGEIVINEGAERIGYSAFLDCKNITNVVIPNSVTELAGETFRNCTSLTGKMIIQDGVALGLNCLNNTGITELEVGEGIYIKQVVSGCNALKKIIIKDNCEFVMGQINNCSALETIEFGENIKLNGSWSDGRYTFKNCPSLKSITIKSISGDVPNWFSSNIAQVLQGEIVINEGATRIGTGAFLNCYKITSITLPSTITDFAGTPFKNCTALQSVKVNMTEEKFAIFMKSTGLSSDVEIIYLQTATE